MIYDKVIIGAGLYGLYAALFCGRRGESVHVLEFDEAPFMRASYINQARVHKGYHYPRSLSTALKSKGYFDRFCEDYSFCINSKFEKIYAVSANQSWTNSLQFKKFCSDADIRCDEVSPETFFRSGMCEGAFITAEFAYDAQILKNWFMQELRKLKNVEISYNVRIAGIGSGREKYTLNLSDGSVYQTGFLLNATYAGINRIHALAGYPPLNIKYELCEIILCKPLEKLRNTGITVMDGAFFSIMPFGDTGLHSLTSVTFTPHHTSNEVLPVFPCQKKSGGYCRPEALGNCNLCCAKPKSAWPYMSNLARKYLRDEFGFEYAGSLYSIKPILKSSEVDDSRPTDIRVYCGHPRFVSVLSGKINTIYELDEELSV